MAICLAKLSARSVKAWAVAPPPTLTPEALVFETNATLGAVVGMAVGLLWGWVFTTALHGQGITSFVIPVTQLVVFLIVAVVAGVIAAWFPARRASRLDVLAAIAAE